MLYKKKVDRNSEKRRKQDLPEKSAQTQIHSATAHKKVKIYLLLFGRLGPLNFPPFRSSLAHEILSATPVCRLLLLLVFFFAQRFHGHT